MTTKSLLRTAAVALVALTATTASAQFSSFPTYSGQGDQAKSLLMQRVSPNLDKESGILLYAATSADGTMYTSWTSFRATQAHSLTRYFPWIEYTNLDDVYRTSLLPATGAYNPDDGKYYLMLTFMYDCIWNAKQTFNYIPKKWFSIDLANGATSAVEIADVSKWSEEQGWNSYSLDPNAPHWGLWMDMSFDPIDETMYALAQSEQTITDDNPYHSAIVKVNLSDGKYNIVKELKNRYYLGFTYDLDGKLYAARWTTDAKNQINGSVIVELDRDSYNEIRTVAEVKKDGTPYKLCYNGTLDVDRATGEIYFAGADFDNGRQSLFKINPKTGACEYMSGFSYDNVVGLHIPYVGTENRNAPARVGNLRTEFAADGSNSITIKWKNPTTQWNLETLTSLSSVKIFRDNMNGAPIAEVKDNLTVGAEASYVDNKATQGLHNYYVVACNENGDGVSDVIAAFVGKDAPDAPLNVVATPGATTATEANISWEAPKTGLHNGWFDAENVKYKVTRSDGVVIAENLSATSVKDEKLDDVLMMQYTYTVTSSNADGVGGSSESAPIYVGSAYPVPSKWDFKNDNASRSTFHGYPFPEYSGWKNNSYEDGWVYWIYEPRKIDESLISPQLNLKAGHTYRVTVNMQFYDNKYKHDFELTFGTSEDKMNAFAKDSFNEAVSGIMYQNYQTEGQFTVEEDGKYVIGFHLISENVDYDKLTVFDVSIEEVFGKDIQAKSVSGYPRINRAKAQNYYVSVFNSGKSDVSGFKAEAGYTNRKDEFISLGETTYNETIAAGETKLVCVPVTADYESGTQVDLRARVTLEGDEFSGNDMCDAIPVLLEDIEGADGFTAEFVGTTLSGGDGYGDTNVPFTTYRPNTTVVTIYPVSMLVTNQVGPYEISRIGFTSYNKIDIDPVDVKVYMGTTDDEMFTGSPVNNVISPSDLELVYSGKSTSMSAGADGISINFDTPFKYDNKKNLVVALQTVCNSGNGGFNIYWNTWDKDLDRYQSLKTNAVTWKPSDASPWYGMPDLHLSLKTDTGVDGINMEAAFGMAVVGRTVVMNGNAETLRVYDLAGRQLGLYNVNGISQVTLSVPDGIYLIKATDAAGNSRTVKAAIR